MLANNITVLYIRDMLLEYIFLHFEPTRNVYGFGIFTYGPIYPSLSLSRTASASAAGRSGALHLPELIDVHLMLPTLLAN